MNDREVPLDDRGMFSNVYSYVGLPFSRDMDDASIDAVVMGIPYDLGTSGRAGTRSGPNAIRQASANLRWEEQRWPWDFKLSQRLNAVDYGDIQFMWGDSDNMLAEAEEHAARITGGGWYDYIKSVANLAGHCRFEYCRL